LNVDGYYDRLSEFLDFMVTSNFLNGQTRANMLIDKTAGGLLSQMQAFFTATTSV
jgi:hypothetical protein